jgi:hypothetical protein
MARTDERRTLTTTKGPKPVTSPWIKSRAPQKIAKFGALKLDGREG